MGRAGEAERQFALYSSTGGALSDEALVGQAQSLARLGRASDEQQVWQRLLQAFPRSLCMRAGSQSAARCASCRVGSLGTSDMSRVRGCPGMRLALALLLVAAHGFAQARERAVVTWTAAASQSAELRGILSELLERDDIDVRFSSQARFGAAELLRTPASDDAVEAFVVPESADRARLYFRAPDGQRFLVRDVALPSGLDAVGRELIAQIVDASVVALLRSQAGISRAQVKAAVEAVPNDAPEATPAAAVAQPTPLSARTPDPSTKASGPAPTPKQGTLAAEAWLGLRYAADWSGSALGVRHGPGLELGVGLHGRAFVRTRFLLERDFPATLQAGPIDARVTLPFAGARCSMAEPRSAEDRALALSVGAGEDSSQIKPTASRSPSVLPAAASRGHRSCCTGRRASNRMVRLRAWCWRRASMCRWSARRMMSIADRLQNSWLRLGACARVRHYPWPGGRTWAFSRLSYFPSASPEMGPLFRLGILELRRIRR